MGFKRLLVIVALLASLLAVPSAASAEISGPQQAPWGLANGAESNSVGRWEALGWSVKQVGGMVFSGGKFLEVTNGPNTVSQAYMAAFDAGDGRFLPWFRPTVGGPVLAIEAAPDGDVFVGGDMGTWNGQTYGAFVKVNAETGDVDRSWPVRVYGGSATVRDVRLEHNGWLYVVGSFTTATDGGGPRSVGGAIRLNPETGAIDWNWTPSVAGAVWGVSVSQTRPEVYLSGWFTDVNGVANTDGFVALDGTGQPVRGRSTIPYNTCLEGCERFYRLYDVIATAHGEVWVVGEQHALYILDESDLSLRLMHYTNCNLQYQDACNRTGGEFQELEAHGDRIYASGHYWGSHMTDSEVIYHGKSSTGRFTGPVNAVTAYDVASGERIQAMDVAMSGTTGGMAIEVASDGCVWAAGGFDSVGSGEDRDPARDLVRFCDDAGAGPDPEPNPVAPAPVACDAVAADVDGGLGATVSWTPVELGHSGAIVYRSVNDGPWFWRAFVPAETTSLTESIPADVEVRYRVKQRYELGWQSNGVDCDNPVGVKVTLRAPASCTAEQDGALASVFWAKASGATRYIVRRQVDGGGMWWRGSVPDPTTTFNDELRGSVIQYSIESVGPTGEVSERTPCSPIDRSEVAAPASCVATLDGATVSVEWAAAAGAQSYVVSRSVGDNAAMWWRGRVDAPATAFSDSPREAKSMAYQVEALAADGSRSNATACGIIEGR